MIKQLLVIPVLFLIGCISAETVSDPNTAKVVDGVATGLSFLGPWGIAGGGLLTTAYASLRSYMTHKSKKKLVMDLSDDTYSEYNNLSIKEKEHLDSKVRSMIPVKYQKYYDEAKVIAAK